MIHNIFSFARAILFRNVPLYVHFAVAKDCNMKCQMCGAVRSRKNEQELNLTQLAVIAENLKKIGAIYVILTGGEPVLRHDLDEIIHLFAIRGMNVRLQTNSSLMTEYKLKSYLAAGLKGLTTSLDTLDEEKQDLITGFAGTRQKVIKALALYSQILPRKGCIVGVNIVVSPLNLPEVPPLVKFISDLGFYASLVPIHVQGQGEEGFNLRVNNERLCFQPGQFDMIDAVYSELIRMKKTGTRVYNSYPFLANSPHFLKCGSVKWKCDSPSLYFSISPGGNFQPCVEHNTDQSVLLTQFPEIFRSKKFVRTVQKQVKSCSGCYYGSMAEMSYFVKKPGTMLDRFRIAYKVATESRPQFTEQEIFNKAESCLQNKSEFC